MMFYLPYNKQQLNPIEIHNLIRMDLIFKASKKSTKQQETYALEFVTIIIESLQNEI